MKWLTRAQASTYMGVSIGTIDRWISERRLTKYKIDGLRSTRLDKDELDAMLTEVSA